VCAQKFIVSATDFNRIGTRQQLTHRQALRLQASPSDKFIACMRRNGWRVMRFTGLEGCAVKSISTRPNHSHGLDPIDFDYCEDQYISRRNIVLALPTA
jgi:hypothetical protein